MQLTCAVARALPCREKARSVEAWRAERESLPSAGDMEREGESSDTDTSKRLLAPCVAHRDKIDEGGSGGGEEEVVMLRAGNN